MVVLLGSSSCGGPTQPTPPPIFLVTCPASVDGQSPDGEAIKVEYSAATVTGGVQPVSVACSPESASNFAVGTTSVQCEARDAAGAVRTCAFNVVVRPPPRLSVTRFMTFGDSMTQGTVALNPTFLVISGPQSYPFKLRNLLTERYKTQTFTIINEGQPGEQAIDGVKRLGGVLREHRPELLLLMQGTNDITHQRISAYDQAIPALEEMVVQAKREGAKVCLATVPPQRPGGARDQAAKLVPGFNELIRAVAQRQEVVLVDVYKAMESDLALIGPDDLHPTERGYQVIAETFFEAIKTAFEVKPEALIPSFR